MSAASLCRCSCLSILLLVCCSEVAFCDTSVEQRGSQACVSGEPKKDHLLMQRAHVTTRSKQPSADCGEACIEACRGSKDCRGECKECPELMQAKSLKEKQTLA